MKLGICAYVLPIFLLPAACDRSSAPSSSSTTSTSTPSVAVAAIGSATVAGSGATAPAVVSAVVPESAAAAPDASPGSSFKELAASTKLIRIKHGTSKTVDVGDAPQVQKIIAALGTTQSATAMLPRCMTPYVVELVDAKSTVVASVGLCDSPGLKEEDKVKARLDVPRAKPAGFEVADLPSLRAVLKPYGIELP